MNASGPDAAGKDAAGADSVGASAVDADAGKLTLRWTTPIPGPGLVLATGAFDILHVGHLRLLELAHQRGHAFAVGVESDARVSAWKGPGRPVNAELDRAAMLAALRCVDGTFIISGDPAVAQWRDYAALFEPLQPAALVFTQGDPFAGPKQRAAVELGAQVWEVAHLPKRSTSAIVDRLEGRSGG